MILGGGGGVASRLSQAYASPEYERLGSELSENETARIVLAQGVRGVPRFLGVDPASLSAIGDRAMAGCGRLVLRWRVQYRAVPAGRM